MRHDRHDIIGRRRPRRIVARRVAVAERQGDLAELAAQSDKEGSPAARFLAALAEYEVADCSRRRIERHMVEARPPAGRTLTTFDFDSVPMLSKAQVMALAVGDVWLMSGGNPLLFGARGCGESHLSAAIGLALVEDGWRVLCTRATDLLQRLQWHWDRRQAKCCKAVLSRRESDRPTST